MQKEISKQRQMFEREAKEGQLDKLCATPFGVDVVGITEFIALTGALVGGNIKFLLVSTANVPDHQHSFPLHIVTLPLSSRHLPSASGTEPAFWHAPSIFNRIAC